MSYLKWPNAPASDISKISENELWRHNRKNKMVKIVVVAKDTRFRKPVVVYRELTGNKVWTTDKDDFLEHFGPVEL